MSDKLIITEKLNKQQLNDIFCEFLKCSEFKIQKFDSTKNSSVVFIDDGVRKFELHYILKNISTGGWKEIKNIYRIQIGTIKDDLVYTNRIRTHMLCGLVKYDNKFIMVVWNSYLYTNHNTNRSCYINVESIEKCAIRGYCLVKEFDQEIWLCDKEHFGLLIRDYINFNYVE